MTPLVSFSQKYQNSIGLGLGSIIFNHSNGILENKFEISSPIYSNSYEARTQKKISTIISPNLYFKKNVIGNVSIRLNASYDYRTFFVDYTGVIFEPNPEFANRNYYNNIYVSKILNLNLGTQYNFRFKKITVYPAIEIASQKQWSKYTEYYTLNNQPYTSISEVFKNDSFEMFLNIFAGINLQCSKRFSVNYEGGLFQNQFAILSRLSLDYHF